jgi:hypothetical protein
LRTCDPRGVRAVQAGANAGLSYVSGKIRYVKKVYLQRRAPLEAKKRIRVAGVSDTAELKKEVQALVRDIVIIRDGGCLLADKTHLFSSFNLPQCGGYRKDGELILQADHLISRGNSATFR